MFPPCKEKSGAELPGDAEEDWAYDAHKSPKLQVVTEVWVEPQFGIVTGVGAKFKYVEGLEYHGVPKAVSRLSIRR